MADVSVKYAFQRLVILKTALEAIIEIEADSPAAYHAAKLIAAEALKDK